MVFLLSSCGKPAPVSGPPGGAKSAQKLKVTTSAVESRLIEYAVEAVGSIEPLEEVSVPARVSGTLDSVRFAEGDTVTEETILAEIDVEKYSLGVSRAQADYDRALSQCKLAETLYANRLQLYEEGRRQKKEWVTEEQMAGWRADVEKAKADAERARVDLELARRNLRDAVVRPPMPGVIHRKQVSKGEYVKPETVVATMLNVSTLRVRFMVNEMEAARLRRGDEATFSIRSAPGVVQRARVFFLGQKSDPSTRAVECLAEVQSPAGDLRPGTFASVRVVTGKRPSLVVPERAVLPTDRGFVVFRTDGKKAASVRVTLGLRVDGTVEITEGLAAGDIILVDGAPSARDGMEIEVVEPK
ncbi:MAG: efflux RND transporter periplasmic adaptor subunit [Planctomycetes bacterium]|nr:efflux RND transporter periplasmic adaptor subunit [Planctomycetota bacterium]